MIIKNLKVNFLVNTILVTSALYLFLVTSREFLIKGINNLAQNLAHFGFSLLILSILFNNFFSTEVITNLKIGETFKSEKINITFESIEKKEIKNYSSIIGKININDPKGLNQTLEPELRIYNQPNIVTSEADIKTNLFSDKFITMNLVQNQDYFNIRYQIKPFMIWIWLSVLLICSGGLISLFRKKI